jgi:hypothetical protein
MNTSLKFIIVIILLNIIFTPRILCDPTEDTHTFAHRDTWSSTVRSFSDYTWPCECNCVEMVKSNKIYNNQPDNYEYLTGVEHIGDLYCQKMELNISACNGNSISSIEISFSNNPACLNNTFKIYKGDGETISENGFNPDNGESGTLNINPPIPACSSRAVTFYLCGPSCMIFSSPLTSNVIFHMGGDPECNRNMVFQYDFVVDDQKVDNNYGDIGNTNYFGKLFVRVNATESNNLSYRIINVLSTTSISGIIQSRDELDEVINNLTLTPGLYLIQILENGKIVAQDKLAVGY